MTNIEPRQKLLKEVRIALGEGLVKVELTPDHLNLAFDMALDMYRQRSVNAVEERIGFLDLIVNQNSYFLPEEIMEVRQLYRRGVTGTMSGTGGFFDPFGAAFIGQFNFTGLASGGDLVTYEIFEEFQNLVGRMFGSQLMFFWHSSIHRLDIQRNVVAPETILMWMYNYRPEELLLVDQYARPWLRRYTIAQAKYFLGEYRGKFGNFGGPNGGVTLNGDALKTAATDEMTKLEEELKTQVDGNIGYGFLWG